MRTRSVVLVLGMMRSGTSALTRVLSLAGCTLPQSVFGPTQWNRTGLWEPVDAAMLNLQFLHRHGIRFPSPTLQLYEDNALGKDDSEAYITRIRGLLAGYPRAPVLVIKEICITELVTFWLEAARREGLDPSVVIVVREPEEVHASLNSFPSVKPQGRTSQQYVNALWLKYNLLAEHGSRSVPHVFVSYAKLVHHWRVEIRRIAAALSLDLTPNEVAIDHFLDPSLQHQRHSGPVIDTFAYSWISRVHTILSNATEGRPVETQVLDEVRKAYAETARAFRLVLDEAREGFSAQQVLEFHRTWSVWKAGRDF